MRLPGHEKELAVGFCLSEGILRSAEGIQLVHHCGRVGAQDSGSAALPGESRNVVRIYCRGEAVAAEDPAVQLVRTGCGRVSFAGSRYVGFPLTRVDSAELRVSFSVLRGLVRSLSENQLTKRLAGGAWVAAGKDWNVFLKKSGSAPAEKPKTAAAGQEPKKELPKTGGSLTLLAAPGVAAVLAGLILAKRGYRNQAWPK